MKVDILQSKLANLNNELKVSNGTDGKVYLLVTTTSPRYGMEGCLETPTPWNARFCFYLRNVHDTVHD